jgi:Rod binding domain-containing protein
MQIGSAYDMNLGALTPGIEFNDLHELSGASDAEAAQDFERLMATMLVKEMRRGLPEGFFGSGPGADSFNAWMDEHVGDAIASTNALDLAGMVKTVIDTKEAADAAA